MNFRDDFDKFEDELWEKADNRTWNDVASTFMEENISYMDGHLLLKLDKNVDDKPDESNDDESHDEHSEDEHSDHESDEEHEDFHVLPAPKDGTLDQAIEKATRVAVTMVRTYLDDFSENMAHYLN